MDNDAQAALCLLYQLAINDLLDGLNSILTLMTEVLTWITAKLNHVLKNLGYYLPLARLFRSTNKNFSDFVVLRWDRCGLQERQLIAD